MRIKLIVYLGAILITFLFPLGVFYIQDHIDIHSSKYKNTEVFQQYRDTYPIISFIYADAYENKESFSSPSYDLSNITSYEAEIQTELFNTKQKIETQIQELIRKQVLPPSIFPEENSTFSISYGNIEFADEFSLSSSYNKTDILETGKIQSQYFTYLEHADKITYLFFSNENIASISEQDCKDIAWHMIEYLGLADIEDWNYLNNGYESYQAKLQVYCQLLENPDGYGSILIGVLPISMNIHPTIG